MPVGEPFSVAVVTSMNLLPAPNPPIASVRPGFFFGLIIHERCQQETELTPTPGVNLLKARQKMETYISLDGVGQAVTMIKMGESHSLNRGWITKQELTRGVSNNQDQSNVTILKNTSVRQISPAFHGNLAHQEVEYFDCRHGTPLR